MGGRIAQRFLLIVPASNNAALAHNHRPHRNLIVFLSDARFFDRRPHVFFVIDTHDRRSSNSTNHSPPNVSHPNKHNADIATGVVRLACIM